MDNEDNARKIFEEQLLLNGFKMVAVEEYSKLPSDKKAFLLKTQSRKLERELKRWASRNNSVILLNPVKIDYEHGKRMFALVVDEDLKDQLPELESVKERLINSHHDVESIKDFLRIRKENASM